MSDYENESWWWLSFVIQDEKNDEGILKPETDAHDAISLV